RGRAAISQRAGGIKTHIVERGRRIDRQEYVVGARGKDQQRRDLNRKHNGGIGAHPRTDEPMAVAQRPFQIHAIRLRHSLRARAQASPMSATVAIGPSGTPQAMPTPRDTIGTIQMIPRRYFSHGRYPVRRASSVSQAIAMAAGSKS